LRLEPLQNRPCRGFGHRGKRYHLWKREERGEIDRGRERIREEKENGGKEKITRG
jgi:hypothetical protein